MVKNPYIPERGDLVWLDFDPQAGHEQKGRRPALVISHKSYNEKVGLALFCPITSKVKGYPFEVEIKSQKIQGAILTDQIKSLDWQIRNIELIDQATEKELQAVLERIALLIN